MEVYKLVNLSVTFDHSARRRRDDGEKTTYKFYGGQKGGQCEGENDTPELPILLHAMREIIIRSVGGWLG